MCSLNKHVKLISYHLVHFVMISGVIVVKGKPGDTSHFLAMQEIRIAKKKDRNEFSESKFLTTNEGLVS